MKIELINTGSELMLGFVLNTHQQWLCRQLSNAGYVVTRQVAIGDTGPEIQQAVRDALPRADVIITTGGLGPTADDLTRDMIAAMFGRNLHLDPSVLTHIEGFFAMRNRPMPQSTRVQAMIPEGATVLENPNGTAPGLMLEIPVEQTGSGRPGLLLMLPGPTRELRPMVLNKVLPILQQRFPHPHSEFVCRTLKTTGLGESVVEERIATPLKSLLEQGLDLGYCARLGEVEVRIVTQGPNAVATAKAAEEIIREQVGTYVFGADDDDLEGVIVRLLSERKETLALAESCTGGYIAHRITNVPGASNVLLCGLVTYSNESKQALLGVKGETLETHGAVSKATAREMAEGVLSQTGATYALAVTGIAGPGGGTPEKPIGTVYIAIAGPFPTLVLHNTNRYDRETFKHMTSQQALDLLRRKVLH